MTEEVRVMRPRTIPKRVLPISEEAEEETFLGVASTGCGVHTALTDTESDSDTCLLRWSLERCQ